MLLTFDCPPTSEMKTPAKSFKSNSYLGLGLCYFIILVCKQLCLLDVIFIRHVHAGNTAWSLHHHNLRSQSHLKLDKDKFMKVHARNS